MMHSMAIAQVSRLARQFENTDTDVRNQIEDILNDPEFDYSDSLWQRFWDWLWSWFENVDTEVEVSEGGPSFLGGIGPILSWLFIIIAIAIVVIVLFFVIKNYVGNPRVKRAKKEDPLVEHRRSVSDWQAMARDFESQGEWKLALRARFRELVRTLIDRRQLPDIAGLTTGELRDRLHETTPTSDAAFDEICSLFEWGWYGRRSVHEHDVARLVELAAIVRAAEVTQAVDRLEVDDFGAIGLLDIEPSLDVVDMESVDFNASDDPFKAVQ